jgi:L-fuconolactonase
MIDAHQHFWKFDPVRDAWITPDMSVIRRDFFPADLEPLLKQNHVEGCVAVQADQSEEETLFLLSLAEQSPMIKAVVGWVDLRRADLRERLQYFSSFKKLKGFRHIVQGEPAGFLKNASFIKGVNLLGEMGYTYDLLIYAHQFEEALGFLHDTRQTKIVIDHIAKPSIRTKEKTRWELDLAAASTFKNVYCKISGMVTEANWKDWSKEDFFPYLDEVFETFGEDRLMYGSDWPVCLLAANYQQQLEILDDYLSRNSSIEKKKIMRENAIQFYNIE